MTIIVHEVLDFASSPNTDPSADSMTIGGVIKFRGQINADEPEEIIEYGLTPGAEQDMESDGAFKKNEHIIRTALDAWRNANNVIEAWVHTVTNEEINEERTRREELGVKIDGIYFRGSDKDRENLTGLYNRAKERIEAGELDHLTNFMDGDNIVHQLTPEQIRTYWIAGMDYVDALYNASWALKAMPRENLDYTADVSWPDNGIL